MRDRALVTSVTDDSILVVPLLSNTCISCGESSCAKRGTPFPVDNPYKLPIACGNIVSVTAKKTATAAQGFFSLLFPIALAALGYAASVPLSRALNTMPSEGFKACSVLAGLVLAVVIVLATSRFATKRAKAVISEIHAEA
jgi:hypothetical protein